MIARPLVGRFSFPRTHPSHLFSETGTPYGAAWKVRPSGPDRGLHRAAAYLEGSPPAGNIQERYLLSVLYLTRYPCRGNGLAFGPWLVTARKGRKKGRSMGKLLPHAPLSHRFQCLRCQLATFEKFLSEFCSPHKIVQTDLIVVSQRYHGLDTRHTFPTLVPAHGAPFEPT